MLLKVLILLLCFTVTGSDDISTPSVAPKFTRNYTIANQTKRYCPRQPNHMQLAAFWCIICFIPFTIIGNVLVCTVILATSSLRKQPMYLFLTSLAVADALVGLLTFPLNAKWLSNAFCWSLPFFLCWVAMLVELTLSLSSTMHLFLIAFDRYLALKYTFGYSNMMTRKRSIYTLLSVWIFSIGWSLLSIFKWKTPHILSIQRGVFGCETSNYLYFKTSYYLLYIIPTFIMLFIYSYIYKTAIHHVNEISKLEVRDSASQTEKVRRKKQFKLIRSVVVVFTAYVICWIPNVIFNLIVYENQLFMRKNRSKDWLIALRFIFASFLPPLNSLVNPFIYVFTNKTFMSAFHTLFTKLTGINLKAKNANSIRSEVTKQTNTDDVTMQMTEYNAVPITLPVGMPSNSQSCMSGIVNELAETTLNQ